LLKYFVLSLALLGAMPAKAEPLLIDVPVIVMTVQEYTRMMEALSKEINDLKTAKSCKKA
jgi:uncharacterized protein (DUF1778 family)